jgi:hypothetical protein
VATNPLTHRMRTLLPQSLQPLARHALFRYRHLGVQADDVLVAAYPKSGSTWLRMVLGMALTGQEPDFDSIRRTVPPIGQHRGAAAVVPGGGRLIKTHELPPPARSRQPRHILLVRDGRDIAVSYYHHYVRRGKFVGTLDEFVPRFISGEGFPFGPWHEHVRSWLHYRRGIDQGRSVLVRYEDLLASPAQVVRQISDTVGLGLIDERIARALAANTPEGMRAKEAESRWVADHTVSGGGSFVRAARAGSWRDELSESAQGAIAAAAGAELRSLGYLTEAQLRDAD